VPEIVTDRETGKEDCVTTLLLLVAIVLPGANPTICATGSEEGNVDERDTLVDVTRLAIGTRGALLSGIIGTLLPFLCAKGIAAFVSFLVTPSFFISLSLSSC
jgi:hypothetical protein